MKIVKMLSPHTDNFDGFLRDSLNEAEVDPGLAGKYMEGMNFPVPVMPVAETGLRAFLNKHKRKFLFWCLAALLTGAGAIYNFRNNSAATNSAAENNKTTTTGTATQTDAATATPAGISPTAAGAAASATNTITNEQGGNTASTQSASGTAATSGNPNSHAATTANGQSVTNDRFNNRSARQGADGSATTTGAEAAGTRIFIETPNNTLTVKPLTKTPAALDSAAKKINAQKLKKDTVDVIW